MLLPGAWGCQYAAEACTAALDWFAGASQRAGGALHPDRQHPFDAPRGEAGVHRGGAVRGVRRRAVVRRLVLGHEPESRVASRPLTGGIRAVWARAERHSARDAAGSAGSRPRLLSV